MPTLVYLEQSFDCATAIKGSDYIRLLDSNGCLIASFDGISDFSAFSLTSGEYTNAKSVGECSLAVIREDGTFAKGGHTCSDIVTKSTKTTATIGTSWAGSAAPYTQTLSISGVTATSVVEIALTSTATKEQVEAFQKLGLQDGGQATNSITLRAFGTKNEIGIPVNVIIRRDL